MNKHVLGHLIRSGYREGMDLWTEESYIVVFAIDVLIDLLEAALLTVPYSFGIEDMRRCCLVASVPTLLYSINKSHRCLSLS